MLAVPLVATLFWHGAFLRHDVIMTRHALIAYAVGLAGIILVKILAPGFYAKQNIRTPVKSGLATLVVTQLLNLAFVPWLEHAGLALAISLGACFNAAWLWWLMRRTGAFRPEPGWLEFLFKVAVALYLMGGVIWYGMGREASWFEIDAVTRAWKLAFVIAGAALTYFVALGIMGFRLRDFIRHG
jgi:putative peptidoglycan lipid II flippase